MTQHSYSNTAEQQRTICFSAAARLVPWSVVNFQFFFIWLIARLALNFRKVQDIWHTGFAAPSTAASFSGAQRTPYLNSQGTQRAPYFYFMRCLCRTVFGTGGSRSPCPGRYRAFSLLAVAVVQFVCVTKPASLAGKQIWFYSSYSIKQG